MRARWRRDLCRVLLLDGVVAEARHGDTLRAIRAAIAARESGQAEARPRSRVLVRGLAAHNQAICQHLADSAICPSCIRNRRSVLRLVTVVAAAYSMTAAYRSGGGAYVLN